jgi:type IV pilus assembly protein PilN
MIRINLLPHREEKRRARRQQFYAVGGLIAVLVGVIWFLGYTVINRYISAQEQQNLFLKTQVAEIDKDIAEIRRLREQTESLLSRKRIIESLQANRTETVYLFNELAHQVPDGVYLKTLKQTAEKIQLTGYAQTNSRVSILMRNLESSPLLEKPDLMEIKAVTLGNRRVSEFNMNVQIKHQSSVDSGKAAGKGTASVDKGKQS